MRESELTQNLFLYSPGSATQPVADELTAAGRLVDRAAKGDEDAFAELYKSFAAMVHGILLARLPYDDVNDAMQEVFVTALRNLHTIRDKNTVGGWLASVARNHAAEYYRSRRQTEELPTDIKVRRDRKAEASEILMAIKTLPETYRETLILRLVEGMTGNEISDRTGLTPESVRVNLHRGMEMLRQKLGINGAAK